MMSVLLYGAKTWTLTERECLKFQAFDMNCQRRILTVKWHDFLTNESISAITGLSGPGRHQTWLTEIYMAAYHGLRTLRRLRRQLEALIVTTHRQRPTDEDREEKEEKKLRHTLQTDRLLNSMIRCLHVYTQQFALQNAYLSLTSYQLCGSL